MSKAIKPDTKLLKGLAKVSPTHKTTCQALAARARSARAPRYETELFRLLATLKEGGADIVERAFYDVFKTLAAARVGVVIVGRGGKPLRFKWFYHPKDVGVAALGRKKLITLRAIGSASRVRAFVEATHEAKALPHKKDQSLEPKKKPNTIIVKCSVLIEGEERTVPVALDLYQEAIKKAFYQTLERGL